MREAVVSAAPTPAIPIIAITTTITATIITSAPFSITSNPSF